MPPRMATAPTTIARVPPVLRPAPPAVLVEVLTTVGVVLVVVGTGETGATPPDSGPLPGTGTDAEEDEATVAVACDVSVWPLAAASAGPAAGPSDRTPT